MKSALKTYHKKCRTIFNAHRSKLSKIVPFPGKKEPTKDNRQFFETAIKEAENTEEFEVAVGEKSYAALTKLEIESRKVRHPANAGAKRFREQMAKILN